MSPECLDGFDAKTGPFSNQKYTRRYPFFLFENVLTLNKDKEGIRLSLLDIDTFLQVKK